MRKSLMFLLLSFSGYSLFSQALTTKNFRDWYNPDSEIRIAFHAVRNGGAIHLFYEILSTQTPLSNYTISWEKRETFTQREGSALAQPDSVILNTEKTQSGMWRWDIPQKPWLLVVKVVNSTTQFSFMSYRQIEATYPVSGWVEQNKTITSKKFVALGDPFQLKNTDGNENFPAALPPFAEKDGKADRFIFHDSTFRISPGVPITLTKAGLYLFQKDTTAAEGLALRAVSKGFPRYNRIEDLVRPLIYICTPDEYAGLEKSNGDKAKFDKIILDITQNKDRASTFMKNYFRRVELANTYFSSYKEGWKTDRGMVYIIYGLPDEVTVNDGSEAWYYKNTRSRFTFVKTGSVYDPDYYVLLRDRRFMSSWYSTIDLWRKSRF
jgi:GWxTD domain-containing protein